MDSKTKHRILGVAVVAGLAIISYPFIQGGLNTTSEQAMVKAPAFPDQAVQVAASDDGMPSSNTESTQSLALETPPASDSVMGPQPAQAPLATPDSTEVKSGNVKTEPSSAPVIKTPGTQKPEQNSAPYQSTSSLTPVTTDALTSALNDVNEKSSLQQQENTGAAPEKVASIKNAAKVASVKKAVKVAKAKSHKNQPVILSRLTRPSAIKANKAKPVDNNGLLQLKQTAWVIQMGSFKEKTNALRLVNKLRAKGYRAFIQHSNVASGDNTRVFVGPEQHQASARFVATELENDLKIHGIVISYKPFTL